MEGMPLSTTVIHPQPSGLSWDLKHPPRRKKWGDTTKIAVSKVQTSDFGYLYVPIIFKEKKLGTLQMI